MAKMRFKQLDLNLLVVFSALMETRSVTRTAERLGLTQPAASASLRRLRAFFGDELLVQVGKRMHPTPLPITFSANPAQPAKR
jgi:DNA-binding transcriptional LysR family regulator